MGANVNNHYYSQRTAMRLELLAAPTSLAARQRTVALLRARPTRLRVSWGPLWPTWGSSFTNHWYVTCGSGTAKRQAVTAI